VAYSYIQYAGNGAQTDFSFAFPYFNASDISVFVTGVSVPFTWMTSSTLKITTAPPAGAVIMIKRTTPKDTTPVNFVDGSVLLEADLDTLAMFSLYAAQEAIDTANLAIVTNSSSNWEAQGKTLQNLGDPVNTQDAVTKGWALTNMASQLAIAIAQASAAAASAGAALSSETSAGVSAAASAVSAAAALVSQDAAAASLASAITQAANALESAGAAAASQVAAAASQVAAAASEATAIAQALSATNSANTAITQASNSATSAAEAASSATATLAALGAAQGGNVTPQAFTGDGSATDFALAAVASTVNKLIVTVSYVLQDSVTAYVLLNSGTTIRFTSPPPAGARILIRYM
jgi:hypothetical protein